MKKKLKKTSGRLKECSTKKQFEVIISEPSSMDVRIRVVFAQKYLHVITHVSTKLKFLVTHCAHEKNIITWIRRCDC